MKNLTLFPILPPLVLGISWVGTTASTIAAQPILLLACVGIPLCGLGVGMFKRLLSARA